MSDGNAERTFFSDPYMAFFTSSDISTEASFLTQADIVFNTESEISQGMEFGSNPGIIFNTTSHGQAGPEFGSEPIVEFSTASNINVEREFATQTDIVFDLESLMRREIRPSVQADVVFSFNEPGHQREIWIGPQADIVFETNDPSWNVENPFVINRFQTDQLIVWDIESDIHNNINFSSQAEIKFNINNFRLLVERNLASTVNIIIGVNNIDSLQNLTLRDLLDPRVRLLTPNQSTTLVSVG
jgi:hypothetical protein